MLISVKYTHEKGTWDLITILDPVYNKWLKNTRHKVGESAWNGILVAHSSIGEGLKRSTVSLNLLSNSVVDKIFLKKKVSRINGVRIKLHKE